MFLLNSKSKEKKSREMGLRGLNYYLALVPSRENMTLCASDLQRNSALQTFAFGTLI